jgi:hypothetical protein
MPVSKKFMAAHRLLEESAAEFKRAHEKGMESANKGDARQRSRGLRDAIASERQAIKKQRKGIELQREAILDANLRGARR